MSPSFLHSFFSCAFFSLAYSRLSLTVVCRSDSSEPARLGVKVRASQKTAFHLYSSSGCKNVAFLNTNRKGKPLITVQTHKLLNNSSSSLSSHILAFHLPFPWLIRIVLEEKIDMLDVAINP